MSMSPDDRAFLQMLLEEVTWYKAQRFAKGAEEHSDAPLEHRACFPEALQEIDDAQTYMWAFRRRLEYWVKRLQIACTEKDWDAVIKVLSEIREEVKSDPPGAVYSTHL